MSWSHKAVDGVQTSRVGSHLVRAAHRYFNRLGNQLAGSIAFFSMLALVPVLMFAFSALGLTLTVIRPDLLGVVQMLIVDNLHAGPFQDQVLSLMSNYLYNWRNLGLIALGTALFIGSSWVANLKAALSAMLRPDFDMVWRRHHALLERVLNVLILLILMVLIAITFTATVIGTQLTGRIVELLRLADFTISQAILRGVSFGLSLIGAALLFWLIFRFLPEEPSPRPAVLIGSVAAAICFVALQTGASLLTALFARGRAFQVFGPTIVLMLFIRLFGQLILFFTAWIATWNQPAIPRRYNRADEILKDRGTTVAVEHHWEDAETDRVRRTRPSKPPAATEPDAGTAGRVVRIGTGASPAQRS